MAGLCVCRACRCARPGLPGAPFSGIKARSPPRLPSAPEIDGPAPHRQVARCARCRAAVAVQRPTDGTMARASRTTGCARTEQFHGCRLADWRIGAPRRTNQRPAAVARCEKKKTDRRSCLLCRVPREVLDQAGKIEADVNWPLLGKRQSLARSGRAAVRPELHVFASGGRYQLGPRLV